MIYSHKPQRSGRSISSNTNNPPQDPPPPPKNNEPIVEPIVESIPETIIDIPINDTTPPVPEICEHVEIPKVKIPKVTTPKVKIPKVTTKVKTVKPVIPEKLITPTVKTLPAKQSIWRRLYNRIAKLWRQK